MERGTTRPGGAVGEVVAATARTRLPEDSPVKTEPQNKDERRGLMNRLSEGGWLLYAALLVVLAVIFGWMFLTTYRAGS